MLLVGQQAIAHDAVNGAKGLHPEKTATAFDKISALNLPPAGHIAMFSIVRRDSVWGARGITVCFGPANAVSDRQVLIEKIIAVADEWTVGTKVSFDWGPKPYRVCENITSAMVRVNVTAPADDNSAYFTSLVGNQSTTSSLAGYEPYSMTLQFPNDSKFFGQTEVFRFYVLHEFGHALGFEHEHQRVECDFDWQYVADHFNFPNVAEAKANMGRIFTSTIHAYPDNEAVIDGVFITTKYDNYSVMKYNLSTKASPGGDDPDIYADGKKSSCYRSGWVSTLTKFDRAGMAKAYGEPLVAISAIAQGLQDTRGGLDTKLKERLSNRTLGRSDVLSAASIKRKFGPLPPSMLTDEERQVKRDIETLKQFPGAISALKAVLTEQPPK
ncbi:MULTISPECIES: hypothetical protein [unclassified Bradyrhizobium]|uniref:hypothetical protein n=1 Tax=unclassified Bradyrhizobium TaxID=2631580 RepID=UPI00291663A8|nr:MULTISPECIES: hypothetical protein [unclassified Bradyrhizobium]